MTRNFDAAIADSKQRLQAQPDSLIWWTLSEAYRGKHMDKESEHALEQFYILTNQSSIAEPLHAAFAHGGRTAVLRWRIDRLKARAPKQYVSPYLLASFYAQLGDRQQALAYLDECIRQHGPPILDIQNETSFDFLHADPHYRAIVQKIGLPPAW
jgi:tetratricopeptide (TPR) repeat protein